MVKKLKLLCTIVVILAVATIIPIAISAAQSSNINVSNIVRFNVQDIEGKFYYAIIGNAPNLKNPEIEHNVGYQENGQINPTLLFSGEAYQGTDSRYQGTYVVYDATRNIITESEIVIPNNGLQFDQYHTEISYYFVFINESVENSNVENEDRSVKVNASANFNHADMKGEWFYVQATTQNPMSVTTMNKNDNVAWRSDTETNALGTGVNVGSKNVEQGTYNYVILRYTLTLLKTTTSFDTDLSLTVTLTSNNLP